MVALIDLEWLRFGFVTAVKEVLSAKEDGLIAGGPPCGPWVWINSNTHQRKKDRIFGNCNRAYVRASNAFLVFGVSL